MSFEHVLVVGAGQMGAGIAQVVAASGRRVSLHDAAPGAVGRGVETMRKSLTRLAEKGGADPDEVLARVTPVDGLVSADLMIEAAVEDAAVKEAIFRDADEMLPETAILASNTSSIPISSLAAATARRDRVIGMHFFNPVPMLALVEVIRGLETSDETAAAITQLAVDLGKTPAQARDFPGFVSNRILMPFINEAAYAVLEGVAEPEAIDTIARLGFAHPMGPLALADLIGLDTCVAIMEVLHHGLGDPKFAPCPLLRQYVQAGRLGRKSGRGFSVLSRARRNSGCAAGPRWTARCRVLSRADSYRYRRSLRHCLAPSIAPRQRALSRRTLLDPGRLRLRHRDALPVHDLPLLDDEERCGLLARAVARVLRAVAEDERRRHEASLDVERCDPAGARERVVESDGELVRGERDAHRAFDDQRVVRK